MAEENLENQEQEQKTQYSIEFDFISFIVCLFIIYIIILAIKTIIERKKHQNQFDIENRW